MKTVAITVGAAGIVVGAFTWPDLTWPLTLLASSAVIVIVAGAVDYITGDRVDQQIADIVDLAEARAARKHYPSEQFGPLAAWDGELGGTE